MSKKKKTAIEIKVEEMAKAKPKKYKRIVLIQSGDEYITQEYYHNLRFGGCCPPHKHLVEETLVEITGKDSPDLVGLLAGAMEEDKKKEDKIKELQDVISEYQRASKAILENKEDK